MSSTIIFSLNLQFLIAIILVSSFFSLSRWQNMESGIFQDLVFTVSLTVIVYFILSKLLLGLDEDASNATCNSDKAFLEYIRKRLLGIGKEKNLGISGFQVAVSEEKVDHEAKTLKEEVDQGNTNEVSGGVVKEVLLEELKGEEGSVRVGGSGGEGAVIKEKVVDECSELRPTSQEIKEEQESPVEETPVTFSLGEEFEIRKTKNEEICGVSEDGDGKETERDAVPNSENREDNNHDEGEELEDELFDDWEGIERSELEKRFDAAVAFVGSESNADRINSNLRMQLYGLHRVAMEGPCHGPQPMALKVSARAKWKAWQKLGNMSADMAMEHYLALLSKSIPGWEDKQ